MLEAVGGCWTKVPHFEIAISQHQHQPRDLYQISHGGKDGSCSTLSSRATGPDSLVTSADLACQRSHKTISLAGMTTQRRVHYGGTGKLAGKWLVYFCRIIRAESACVVRRGSAPNKRDRCGTRLSYMISLWQVSRHLVPPCADVHGWMDYISTCAGPTATSEWLELYACGVTSSVRLTRPSLTTTSIWTEEQPG